MMPDLQKIYDPAFFRDWGSANENYVRGARLIVDLLWDVYRPARVVDLGCGCAVYADAFRKKGASVVAVDGVRPPSESSFPGAIEIRDLTVPFDNPWGPFDLALCLEVAEHIPEDLSDAFLANITRFSDRLVLSAAQPGQGGHHHVNEQPKRYWVQKLSRHGFAYRRPATGRLQEAFKTATRLPFKWMGEHISVYERMTAGFPVNEYLPFRTRPAQPPPKSSGRRIASIAFLLLLFLVFCVHPIQSRGKDAFQKDPPVLVPHRQSFRREEERLFHPQEPRAEKRRLGPRPPKKPKGPGREPFRRYRVLSDARRRAADPRAPRARGAFLESAAEPDPAPAPVPEVHQEPA